MSEPAVVGEGPEDDDAPALRDDKAARDFAESSQVEPIPSDAPPPPRTDAGATAIDRLNPAPPPA